MTQNRILHFLLVFVSLLSLIFSTNQLVSTNASYTAQKSSKAHLPLYSPASIAGKGGLASLDEKNSLRLPVAFVPNKGQVEDTDVKFQAANLGDGVFFKPGEMQLLIGDLPSNMPAANGQDRPTSHAQEHAQNGKPPFALKVQYQGFNKNASVTGTGDLPGKMNYFIGNDKAKWVTDVETYDSIVYQEFYPGINLLVSGKDGQVKTSFIVSPQVNPSIIQWKYDGAQDISLDDQGNLVISVKRGTDTRTIKETAPIAWQVINGETKWIPITFAIDHNSVSFVLPDGYDPSVELTIDPTIVWATYLGNNGTDGGSVISRDSTGTIVVGGYSYCTNYPLVNPYQGANGSLGMVISKLDPSGTTLLYSTCLGGVSGTEELKGLALDAQNNIIVSTSSAVGDFPIVNGVSTLAGGNCGGEVCEDIIVAKLSAAGNALLYSTYLGGTQDDDAERVAVGTDGKIYVVGRVASSDFPTTTNAYDRSWYSAYDATDPTVPLDDITVTKINPNATGLAAFEYSTYLGGNDWDDGYDIAVDNNNKVYVVGYTYSGSGSFPVVNAIQTASKGNADTILAKLDMTKSGTESLEFSTYLGGSGYEKAFGVDVDNFGNAYITGFTKSSNYFSTSNAFQKTVGGGEDAFAMKVDTINKQVVYRTYLGGSGNEEGNDIAVDSAGNAYVVGYTYSTNFPTASPTQSRPTETCGTTPCQDAFISVLNASGSALLFSTYLGGGGNDYAKNVMVDANGNSFVTGSTWSGDFPVTDGSYDTSNPQANNKSDIFVVKFSPLGQSGATPTPTVPPTATSTPIPPTITITPPTPPICIAAQTCELAISVDTPEFTQGDTVTINWQIINADPFAPASVPNWRIHLALPVGFTPENPASGTYDAVAQTFAVPVPATIGTIKLKTAPTVGDSVIKGDLRDGTNPLYSDASLNLVAIHTEIVTAVATAEVEVPDANGDLTVVIPPAVLPANAEVSVWSPVDDPANPTLPAAPMNDGKLYEIQAINLTDGSEIHQLNDLNPTAPPQECNPISDPDNCVLGDYDFSGKALLKVPVDPAYLDPETSPVDPSSMKVQAYDETTGEWEDLPTKFDSTTNTLIAATTHFSLFSTNASSFDKIIVPPLDAAQTSEFTGSASYSLPITIPAGPGGVAPSVSIGYSNQSVEGSSLNTQASIVGMGWSLSAGGSIIRNVNTNQNWEGDDTFSISVGGVSSQLVPTAVGLTIPTGCYPSTEKYYSWIDYSVQDQNFWKIRRYRNAPGTDRNGCVENDYWVVWDKTGTRYTFGDDPAHRAQYFEVNSIHTHRAWGWYLSQAEYPNGQIVKYTYEMTGHNRTQNGSLGWFIESVRVLQISYDFVNNAPYYTVDFGYSLRQDRNGAWESGESSAASFFKHETKKLDWIAVKVHDAANPGGKTIHEYRMQYWGYPVTIHTEMSTPPIFPENRWVPDSKEASLKGKTLVLTQVTEYGVGGYNFDYDTSKPNNGCGDQCRPPIKFTYGEKDSQGSVVNPNNFMFLTQVDNGQGGLVTFIYNDPYSVLLQKEDSTHFVFNQNAASENDRPFIAENGDPDVGTNNLQTKPVELHISSARVLAGTFNANPGMAYKVTCQVNDTAAGTVYFYAEFKVRNSSNQIIGQTIYGSDQTAPVGTNSLSQTFLFPSNITDGNNIPIGTVTVSVYKKSGGVLRLNSCNSYSLVTHYRVTKRIAEDKVSGHKIVTKYDYTGGYVNENQTVPLGDGTIKGSVKASHFDTNNRFKGLTHPNTDFWGHATVALHQESADGSLIGNTTITNYYQNDTMLGRVKSTEVRSSDGHTLSTSSSNILDANISPNWYDKTVQTYCAKKIATTDICYQDRNIFWTYTDSEVSKKFTKGADATSDRFMGARTEYGYDAFGNANWTVVKVYAGLNKDDSTKWPYYRAVKTGYVTRLFDGSNYWVGLTLSTTTYKCTDTACSYAAADVVSASCTMYYDPSGSANKVCRINSDGTTTTIDPVSALPWVTRTLVRFNGSGYGDPRYKDQIVTYANGNVIKTETSRAEGTAADLAMDIAPTKSNFSVSAYRSDMGYTTVCSQSTSNTAISYQNCTLNTLPGGAIVWTTKYVYTAGSNEFFLGQPSSETDINNAGQPYSETDINDAVATAVYDKFGRITALTLPDGDNFARSAITAEYKDFKDQDNPAWVKTSSLFDADTNRRIETQSLYDGFGRKFVSFQSNVKVFTGLTGNTPSFATGQYVYNYSSFDGLGREKGQSVPYNSSSPTSPKLYKLPDGQPKTDTVYDSAGNVSSTVAANGQATNYDRYIIKDGDHMASVSKVTDAAGNITETYVNSFGKTIRVILENGAGDTLSDIRYDYDTSDNLTQITPYAGATPTTFTYDFIGRKTSMTDPDMGTWSYGYDAAGNLVWQKDAKNAVTCTYYDSMNRVTGVLDSCALDANGNPPAEPTFDFNNPTGKKSIAYTYDQTGTITIGGESFTFANTKGKVTTTQFPAGTLYTTYNIRGQINDQWVVFANSLGSFPYEIKNTYYFDGQIKTTTYPDNAHTMVTAERDDAGRAISLKRSGDTNPILGGSNTAYDVFGRERYVAAGNNIYRYQDYYDYSPSVSSEKRGKLREITAKTIDTSNVLFDQTVTEYFVIGNIKTMTDTIGGVDQTNQYTYDALGRLKTATAPATTTASAYNQEFIYDGENAGEQLTGRLEARLDKNADGTQKLDSFKYQYDQNHPHQVIGFSDEINNAGSHGTYQYDANGNMTCRVEDGVVYKQSWTATNMLKKVEWNEKGDSQPIPPDCSTDPVGGYNHEVTFTYDASGNRILRVEKISDGLGQPAEFVTIYLGGIYEKQIATGSSTMTDYLRDWKR